MTTMPHYLEYQTLFNDWTYPELRTAYRALVDDDLQDLLFQKESPLLAFLIDADLQEKLCLYFEDLRESNIDTSDLDIRKKQ